MNHISDIHCTISKALIITYKSQRIVYPSLSGFHGVLVELPLVGGGLPGAEGGPGEAQLLRAAAQRAQVVHHHVQVLGLVQVVHLEDVITQLGCVFTMNNRYCDT